jgi:Flp pilus assembly pilin Flp
VFPVRTLILRLLRDDRGQDLVEYALLTSAIGFAGIAAWELVRVSIGAAYQSWEDGVNALWESPPPGGV